MVIACLLFVILGVLLPICQSGHEVLYQFPIGSLLMRPEDIAIVQFDSRPLGNYWNITARWNRAYCDKYHHHYFYITQKSAATCENDQNQLGIPWCKVKAMITADWQLPASVAYIVFMDSDAIATANYSMNTILSFISRELQWNWEAKPLAFNQDGPGYACKQAIALGYPICLNSGVVVWKRTSLARTILQSWWMASNNGLQSTKFPMNWRLRWPWEQAQQYEIYMKYSSFIMLLSFPKLPFLPWTSKKKPNAQYPSDSIEPWCFTHWPGANCFITHFCASSKQKQKMRVEYDRITDNVPIALLTIP